MAIVLKWTLQCVVYVYLLIATFSIPLSRAGNNSLTPDGTLCLCPNVALSLTCNILGGGATVWRGTTLGCVGRDITLRHDLDNFQPGTFSLCNGDIIREIVGIEEDNCYISRLNFTARADQFNNTITECLVQDSEISPVGNFTVFVAPVSYYLQEPSGAMVSKVNVTDITFNWAAVNPVCSRSISYNVTSSNCSSVTCITTRNEATCSNLPIANMCAFNIRSEICGQTETVNNVITVILRRPRTSITLVYSADSSSTLTKVMITIYPEPFFSIAGDVPSPITGYNFSYSNVNISIPACQEHEMICVRSVDTTTTFDCPRSTKINVTLSALNGFGQGPSSDPTTIGCTNEFVNVEYLSTTSTITCAFLDQTDTSIKSCSVMYGQQCEEMLIPGSQQNSTAEDPYSITLSVPENINCYEITASNGSFTIVVEGTNFVNADKAKKKSWSEYPHSEQKKDSTTEKIMKKFQLKEESSGRFRIIDVTQKVKIKKLEQQLQREFSRGYIYCKVQHNLETLPENTEVILMDKVANIFSSNISSLKQLKDKKEPLEDSLTSFKVLFVRSTGSESDMEKGSVILYEVLKTE